MIRIEVTAFDGELAKPPLVGEFDEQGGTIGRAEGSTLLLPDPKRYISRTHASVIFRSGEYFIRDVGTASPVVINGEPLGMGREARIRAGDSISIADYTLRVVDGGRKVTSSAQGSKASRPNAAAIAAASAPTANSFDDVIRPAPRETADAGSAVSRNPPSTSKMSTGELRGAMSASAPASDSLPGGIDPFADPASPASVAESSTPDLPSDLHGKARATDFDRMFGLEGSGSAGIADPNDPLGSVGPSSSGGVDPLVAIGAAPRKDAFKPDRVVVDPLEAMGFAAPERPIAGPVQRDDVLEINTPFALPQFKPGPLDGEEGDRGANLRKASPQTGDASLRNESSQVGGANLPKNPSQAHGGLGTHADAPAGDSRGIDLQPPPKSPATRGASAEDELVRAFLAGAGVPDVAFPRGLTPEMMNILGQLLRECTQGTLDLLLARAITKRQLSAGVTMIVARENNPLKFSPNVEVALSHLLAPQGRGFMTPVRALKDAYNDLRSHEIAFMAGMRAALTGVLARFRPDHLERRLTQTSVLDSLLPINRQAKLWALFGELYAEISKEAEDNFHTLFGREFLRAYEAQIEKLEREDRSDADPSA